MSELFVSYKREDAPRAAALVEALRSAGFSTFWDQDIPPGSNWQIALEKALDAAQLCIVVWSQHSVKPEGHFVREEARRAALRGAYLGVLVDAVLPPLGFGEWQAFDMASWDGAADHPLLLGLVRHIRARLDGGPVPDLPAAAAPPVSAAAPAPRRPRKLRSALIAVAALVLLTAAATGFGFYRADQCRARQNDLIAQLRATTNMANLRNNDLMDRLEVNRERGIDADAVRAWWSGGGSSDSLPSLLRKVFGSENGLEIGDADEHFTPLPPIQEVIDREGGELKDGLLRLFNSEAMTRPAPDLSGQTVDDLLAELGWLVDRLEIYAQPEHLRVPGGCGIWNSLIRG